MYKYKRCWYKNINGKQWTWIRIGFYWFLIVFSLINLRRKILDINCGLQKNSVTRLIRRETEITKQKNIIFNTVTRIYDLRFESEIQRACTLLHSWLQSPYLALHGISLRLKSYFFISRSYTIPLMVTAVSFPLHSLFSQNIEQFFLQKASNKLYVCNGNTRFLEPYSEILFGWFFSLIPVMYTYSSEMESSLYLRNVPISHDKSCKLSISILRKEPLRARECVCV
jgi:hypothetical protein